MSPESRNGLRRGECGSGLGRLTSRQAEVAWLVTRGLSNPEIALALRISVGTAKKHVRDLFERLDVSSRAELAAQLVGLRLVNEDAVAVGAVVAAVASPLGTLPSP